jgi:hypothetical protein
MPYYGDRLPGDTVDMKFNTVNTSLAPATLGGTPAVSIYKNNSTTTETTTGVTLTVDLDSKTGLHHVRIDTSTDSTFYANGNDYAAVITTGTVAGTSVVGAVVGTFSIGNRRDATIVKLLQSSPK